MARRRAWLTINPHRTPHWTIALVVRNPQLADSYRLGLALRMAATALVHFWMRLKRLLTQATDFTLARQKRLHLLANVVRLQCTIMIAQLHCLELLRPLA